MLSKATIASALILALAAGSRGDTDPTMSLVRSRADAEYNSLFELYKDFHSNPELSFQESRTSKKLADQLRGAGFEVTTGVGRYGVVAVLRNGPGATVLVRSDMDALPVKEQTGLDFASVATAKGPAGSEVPTMHACGHDIHMSCLVGVARVLNNLRANWSGTLVLIGQPAEEIVGGARAMLADGLYTRFPKPDYCLALHDSDKSPAGTVSYTSGYAMAAVDSIDIVVHGEGGHGAQPDKTRDPIVLAAQIVLGLQTLVSREVTPGDPAVVTIGTIHGGIKRNIIPDEVRLQLTVRSYSETTRTKLLAGIKRIARGQAMAAGLPETKMPEVIANAESVSATYNDPELTSRVVGALKRTLGVNNVVEQKPLMVSEDFGLFGMVEPRIPSLLFHLGALDARTMEAARNGGNPLPSLHSPIWAPVPEPTIKTGIISMSAAVLELLPKSK